MLAAVAAGGPGGVRVGGTASQEPEASFDLAHLARSIMEPQRLGFSAVTLLVRRCLTWRRGDDEARQPAQRPLC